MFVTQEMIEPWVKVTPQQPFQNYVNCYGVIKIQNELFTLSDVITDEIDLPHQKNTFEFVRKKTIKRNVS